MQLNFQLFGESGPALILVHGLFGSIANWRGVARELSKDFKVYVVDQRNHGDSPQANTMSYRDMADDLDAFIASLQLRDFVLCGHSMGGKAAMVYALSDYASVKEMRSLIVLDIAPVAYSHSHAPFLESMAEIDITSIGSRSEADKLLQVAIPDSATRLFLMQSLERKDGLFRWKLNLRVLHEYMTQIVGFPEEVLLNQVSEHSTLFLYGERSEYVQPTMFGLIQKHFPQALFDSVDAGHWIHVEQRQAMIEAMKRFLNV